MRVALKFSGRHPQRVDVGDLPIVELPGMPESEIERLTVGVAGIRVQLGEVCQVRKTTSLNEEVIFTGATERLSSAGKGMNAGTLIIEGDAGDEVGLAMCSGVIRVQGNVRDWCGANEPSQTSGMRGGMILIEGSAGEHTGARMRGGLIAVKKSMGDTAGMHMLAGTILAITGCGNHPGAGMRRGSILVGKAKSFLPGFFPAGQGDLEWIRILAMQLTHIGFAFPKTWLNATPSRFTGDHLGLGKGEILIYG